MAAKRIIGTEEDFRHFLKKYDSQKFRSDLITNFDLNSKDADETLSIYLAEMIHGYRFVSEHIPNGKLRILEVGSGLGLISIYLKRLGHDVVALEPAGISFDFFEATKKEIWDNLKVPKPALVEKKAEELSVAEDGQFDFSFSVNVMEHIEDIETATHAILNVLKPGSMSANYCANYLIPYEPHYAIPMVPFSSRLTRKIFEATIVKKPDIWESLNFIDYFRVKKMAKDNSVEVKFEKGSIYKTLMRLEKDEKFLERHRNSFVYKAYKILKFTKLLLLLKWVPAALSTPMTFIYKKSN